MGVKQIEKNLSKGRQEIVTALARMREILTSKAMQFVQNYGLDLKGRDGNLASFADQVETKWIKLYKRTTNGAPIPPLTFGDGEKQHRAFKKQSKKLLKSYIKHKLGQKLEPIITVKQRGRGSGVTGREIELGSLWGDIMGDSEGSESAVGAEKKKTMKKTEAWKKATDEFMTDLRQASARLDSLKEQLVVEEAATKRKVKMQEFKQNLEKQKEDQKKAVKKVKSKAKAAEKAKKARAKAVKKMKVAVKKEKKKLLKESKKLEKKLMKKAEAKIEKKKAELNNYVEEKEKKSLKDVYAPKLQKMAKRAEDVKKEAKKQKKEAKKQLKE